MREPTVHLVGRDPDLLERLEAALPDRVRVNRANVLRSEPGPSETPHLTLVRVGHLDIDEGRRIEEALASWPRRTAVVCREADPRIVFELGNRVAAYGLLGVARVEEPGLSGRLSEWVRGGEITPNWRALGVDPDAAGYGVQRALRAIERNPFHDWRVDDLARALRVGRRTLQREFRSATGEAPKRFLLRARRWLVRRALATGMPEDEAVRRFGFPSRARLRSTLEGDP